MHGISRFVEMTKLNAKKLHSYHFECNEKSHKAANAKLSKCMGFLASFEMTKQNAKKTHTCHFECNEKAHKAANAILNSYNLNQMPRIKNAFQIALGIERHV